MSSQEPVGPQRCLRDQRKINENYVTVMRKGWFAACALSAAIRSHTCRLLKKKGRKKGLQSRSSLTTGEYASWETACLTEQNLSDCAKRLGSPGQYKITCWGWSKLRGPENQRSMQTQRLEEKSCCSESI